MECTLKLKQTQTGSLQIRSNEPLADAIKVNSSSRAPASKSPSFSGYLSPFVPSLDRRRPIVTTLYYLSNPEPSPLSTGAA